VDINEFPAFKSLNATQLEDLRGAAEEISAAEGEKLIERGEVGGAMYLLLEGELRVYIDEGGKEVVLVDLHAPAVVGELELLTHKPRTASVRVLTRSRLLAIPHDRIQARIEDGDPAVLKVMYAISQLIAARLVSLTDMFVEMEASASPGRSDELRAFRTKLFSEWSFGEGG
jgi:CRP-like cAMP-binding protein